MGRPQGRAGREGAVLLEVIFSLTLFAATAAVVIGGLNSCIQGANDLRTGSQAADMAVTLMSEIQMGLVPPTDSGPTDYPAPDDDWTWQIVTAAMDPVAPAPPQKQITITITNKTAAYSYSLVNVISDSSAATGAETSGASTTAGGGASP